MNPSVKNATRILCISPVFVPTADSEAFCGAKLVTELRKRDADVVVFSLDSKGTWQKILDDSDLWKPLKDITVKIPTPSNREILRSFLMGLKYRTIIYARWLEAVIGHAKLLHQKRSFDLIYSRSLPMEAHIAGYWIARVLRIPWFANINDPWDWHLYPDELRQYYRYYYTAFSNFWMRRTFRTASLITYPSDRLRDYHYRISGVEHKSGIIPHIGYKSVLQKTNSTKFCLVHAGKLSMRSKRSSIGLLRGLSLFLRKYPEARSSVRMIFVGAGGNTTQSVLEELGLESIVECTGQVSYERSLEYIGSASVCILIEAKMAEGIFFPSKLADYIVAGKPVLALSPQFGVAADIAQHKGILRVDPDDEVSIGTAFARYYNVFMKKAMASLSPSSDLIRKFEADAVIDSFNGQIREVLKIHEWGLV
jgi:glycosyltransferase involved in cell wall biosynthesis